MCTAPQLSGRVVGLVELNVVVQVLGTHVSRSYVRDADGTLGWVLTHSIEDHPKAGRAVA